MSLRPFRIAVIWFALTITTISLFAVCAFVYFPALARTDREFLKLLAIGGSPFVYIFVLLQTGYTPFYWLAVGCVKVEAHQHQAAIILLEAVEEYKRRRPQTERELRKEIGNANS